MKEFQDLK
jgi:hypothetical protein